MIPYFHAVWGIRRADEKRRLGSNAQRILHILRHEWAALIMTIPLSLAQHGPHADDPLVLNWTEELKQRAPLQ